MEVDTQAGTLAELAGHIVGTHHQYLRGAMPRVTAWIGELRQGTGTDAVLDALAPVFAAMRAELELHMSKEEIVLFPFIARMDRSLAERLPRPRPPFGSVENPSRMMEQEHDNALAALAEMRRLTGGYSLPPGAENIYQALYRELEEMERDLQLHIHLENDILFPRAVSMERGS